MFGNFDYQKFRLSSLIIIFYRIQWFIIKFKFNMWCITYHIQLTNYSGTYIYYTLSIVYRYTKDLDGFFTNYFIRLLKLFWIYEFKIIPNHGKICRITYLNAEFILTDYKKYSKYFLMHIHQKIISCESISYNESK